MRNIFVDIDGTLTNETEGWGNKAYSERTPKHYIINIVNDFAKHDNITIWTSRFEEDREVTVKWLKDNKVMYNNIIFGKPQYDLFIDDKTLNPSEMT